MTIASDSLTPPQNLSHHHHQPKESFMKYLLKLITLSLIVLAPASAFAVTSLGVNITVTITSSNAVEWSIADAAADVTGQREWAVTGAAVNMAYLSTTVAAGNTIVGPSSSVIAVKATALNFTNKGNISITSSVTVANGTQWNFGGATALDVFMLEAYTDGGTTPIATKVSGSALSLLTTQATGDVCNLALRITTPSSVSASAKLSSAQVATILSTQN